MRPEAAGGASDPVRTTAQTYDRIAAAYAERAVVTPAVREHLDRFVAAVVPGGLVVDAGCGPGHLSALLADAGLSALAMDTSVAMLRLARGRASAVRADLRRLPVAPGSLDGLWSAASLLHVPRDQTAATLRSWCQALRPGGVLGLSTSVGADEEGWEDVPYAPAADDVPRRWFVHHDADRLLGLVRAAGLDVVDASTRVSHRTWLQVVAVRPPA